MKIYLTVLTVLIAGWFLLICNQISVLYRISSSHQQRIEQNIEDIGMMGSCMRFPETKNVFCPDGGFKQ